MCLDLGAMGPYPLRMLGPRSRSVAHALGLLLALWAAETPLGAQAACIREPAGMAAGSRHHHGDHGPPEHGASTQLCCNLCTVVGPIGSLPRPSVSELRLVIHHSPLPLFPVDPARAGLLGAIALPPSLGPPQNRT